MSPGAHTRATLNWAGEVAGTSQARRPPGPAEPCRSGSLRSRGEVPDQHRAVLAGGCQPLAVGAEGQGVDPASVARELPDGPGAPHFPDAGRPGPTRRQELAVGG